VAEGALEKFSAGFLTERLRASRALPCGRVLAVDVGEHRPTLVSTAVPLRVEYSSDAPAAAPTRLFLKTTRGGLDPGLRSIGEREVAFYADGSFHLLLEDLSETHALVTAWPLPPSDEACERIIDIWAGFHAFWWRHPSLGRELGSFLDDAALAKITVDYRERYTRFADTLGDRLWPAARATYARVHDARERLITPARLYATYTWIEQVPHVRIAVAEPRRTPRSRCYRLQSRAPLGGLPALRHRSLVVASSPRHRGLRGSGLRRASLR